MDRDPHSTQIDTSKMYYQNKSYHLSAWFVERFVPSILCADVKISFNQQPCVIGVLLSPFTCAERTRKD